jgi:hypothetical protein
MDPFEGNTVQGNILDADMLDVLQCIALPVIKPADEKIYERAAGVATTVATTLAPYPCTHATASGRAFFPPFVNHMLVARVLKYMLFYGLKDTSLVDLRVAATDVLYMPCACGAPSLIQKIMNYESQFDVASHVFIHGFPAHALSFMYDAYLLMLHVPDIE